MKTKSLYLLCLLSAAILRWPALAADEIPAQRAKQIYDAAPAKARVAPKKPRRVLIWLTPPHLMEKDPHKGYCIPYGTSAFETLGRKTGAFVPVVSGDLSLFLPEKIQQFDAIVMNNSSGPWITPTDADMAEQEFNPGDTVGRIRRIPLPKRRSKSSGRRRAPSRRS